jgi:ribosome-associated translation inhibitor RaiA
MSPKITALFCALLNFVIYCKRDFVSSQGICLALQEDLPMNPLIEFEFVGFNPEYELREFISSVADRIYNLSPSDSSMRLVMKKNRNSIQVSCMVISRAGVFSANATCNCPKLAIQKIEEAIRYQLEKWRQCRFSSCNNSSIVGSRVERQKLSTAV